MTQGGTAARQQFQQHRLSVICQWLFTPPCGRLHKKHGGGGDGVRPRRLLLRELEVNEVEVEQLL